MLTRGQGLESLIFGNIPAYADGTDLWAKPTGNYKPQRVDDGVVEIIGHKGSIHLVQIKAGVSRAFQLGQGRRIKMQTRDVLPMQLDGEPWLQVLFLVVPNRARRGSHPPTTGSGADSDRAPKSGVDDRPQKPQEQEGTNSGVTGW